VAVLTSLVPTSLLPDRSISRSLFLFRSYQP